MIRARHLRRFPPFSDNGRLPARGREGDRMSQRELFAHGLAAVVIWGLILLAGYLLSG